MNASGQVHPTAIVDPAAQLAADVLVGPFAIIEGPVILGPGCHVRARAHLLGPLSAGEGNDFGINCVVGERAQHLVFQDEPGAVEIGAHNVFRENVTVHRSTPQGQPTSIGSYNFLMANCHVAHDCRIGDHCIVANGAVMGGHVSIGDRAFLSGNTAVHQYCRIGRCAMLSASSCATVDIPPFATHLRRNELAGVNLVGMRRSGFNTVQINAIRQAYRVLLCSGELLKPAVLRIERELGHIDVIRELVAFIRESKRGICLSHARRASDITLAADAA